MLTQLFDTRYAFDLFTKSPGGSMIWIKGEVFTRLSGSPPGSQIQRANAKTIARDTGFVCETFAELQNAVAEIGYYNHRFDVFLRGQSTDYPNPAGFSTLSPALHRHKSKRTYAAARADLEAKSAALEASPNRPGVMALRAHQSARWALLQHYGLANTPLLDVTRSTRIAASFALLGDDEQDRFVYALGLPHPQGNITFEHNSEVSICNLRNLCPPDARRPHWQDGYLVGTYPGGKRFTRQSSSKEPTRQDFARRLLGKFRIPARSRLDFFPTEHPAVPESLLYPPDDPVKDWLDSYLSMR